MIKTIEDAKKYITRFEGESDFRYNQRVCKILSNPTKSEKLMVDKTKKVEKKVLKRRRK